MLQITVALQRDAQHKSVSRAVRGGGRGKQCASLVAHVLRCLCVTDRLQEPHTCTVVLRRVTGGMWAGGEGEDAWFPQ